jgi:hypothetical protein
MTANEYRPERASVSVYNLRAPAGSGGDPFFDGFRHLTTVENRIKEKKKRLEAEAADRLSDLTIIVPTGVVRLGAEGWSTISDLVVWHYPDPVTSKPPARAELIIYWICKPERAEATLGCMEEVFRKIIKRHGLTQAQWWFWWQTVRAVGAFLIEIVGKIPKSLLPTSN